MRAYLPAMSFGLLFLTYATAAAIGGLFLSQHLSKFGPLGHILAYTIGISVQAVRAVIVYFNQLNPDRPALSAWQSKTAAVILGGLSIWEISKLTASLGVDPAVTVSLGLLMAAGVVIELFLLVEIQTATNTQFFGDPAKRQALIAAMKAQREFERFVEQLNAEALEPVQTSSPTDYRAKHPEPDYDRAADIVEGENFHDAAALLRQADQQQRAKVAPEILAEVHVNGNGNGHAGNGRAKGKK